VFQERSGTQECLFFSLSISLISLLLECRLEWGRCFFLQRLVSAADTAVDLPKYWKNVGVVMHAYNLRYLGSRGRRPRQSWRSAIS
jgi:hypothetical protein